MSGALLNDAHKWRKYILNMDIDADSAQWLLELTDDQIIDEYLLYLRRLEAFPGLLFLHQNI